MTINDQDLNDPLGVKLVGKTNTLRTDYYTKSSFFNPELLSLNKDEYNNLFKNKKLLKYKSMLDDIYRYKNHILDKNEEEKKELEEKYNPDNLFKKEKQIKILKEENTSLIEYKKTNMLK